MKSGQNARERLYDLLEASRLRGLASVVQGALVLLIVANVAAVVIETVEPIHRAHAVFFHRFEVISVALFAVEYVLRLYSCTASAREQYQHPVWGRLRFALTPMALLDLAAIAPFFIYVFFGVDFGALRMLRVLRVLKLMRYSPSMSTLGRIIYNERKSLAGALVIFVVVLLLASTGTYYVEHSRQPVAFGSIPAAMWWAMAALTTVGYGDVTPITPIGRVMGSMITLAGVGVIALPTGIVASAFIEEAKRRDFTVTWSLLAGVPFFQQLRAPRIGDLVRAVRPHFVQAGELIIRKGQMGDSMFIIAAGEVEVVLDHGRGTIVLGAGDFFGELALLERAPRMANVRAVTDCRLLELDSGDLQGLMKLHPELDAAVHKIAAERRKPS